MALAYAQYLGNGSTKVFNVTFPYLHKDHITVKVNAVPVAYTWNNATQVALATAPAPGDIVDVRRVTPRDRLLVDFLDGSTLVESDLDLSAIQVFYLAQEAFDLGEASLGVTEDGSFSALNRRISNVLNPVQPQDVVTKLWAETAMTSQLAIAIQKANEAASSAGQSVASATSSAGQAAAALASKNAAAGSATAAAQSEAAALAYKNQTQLDRAATAADRVQTGLDREAAAASASAAAKSAQDAALFDPDSYYIRSQVDDLLAMKAPKVDPTFQGVVKAPTIQINGADGVNTLGAGNGDGASYTTHNILLTGKSGLGMKAAGGLVNGFYDFQAGKWDVKGGFFKNGVEALYQNGGSLNGRLYTPIINVPIVNNVATIDLSKGSVFFITLTQNITLDVTGLPPEGQQQDWVVIVRQDATGGRTVSSTSAFAWAGETAMPSVDARANAYHIFAGIGWNNRAIGKSGGGFI